MHRVTIAPEDQEANHQRYRRAIRIWQHNLGGLRAGRFDGGEPDIKGEIMLGEHIGTISGPTSMKAIAAVGGMPTFETAASGLTGTLAGADVTSFASYSATMRADGSFYGECPNAGVVMAADGVATFRATGCGNPSADGGFVFKGVVYFEAHAASLSSLNGKAVVYDWIVGPDGSATWDLWEWI